MEANRSRDQSLGAVRDGPALLARLVVCGRCGTRMTVRYQRGAGGKLHPGYVCARAKSHYGRPTCQQLAGRFVDGHVTVLLLQAMAPAALEVSLAAVEQAEASGPSGPDPAPAPGARRAATGKNGRNRSRSASLRSPRPMTRPTTPQADSHKIGRTVSGGGALPCGSLWPRSAWPTWWRSAHSPNRPPKAGRAPPGRWSRARAAGDP
ncbi:zinc ribbon domain-containing protein [Peterkaempfera sp. SMS 1(5)a]|uniref:zinc ribbon domain-containing protein n=1 Tax=Peterkaempfera podocarpi TaxID=3232308 RepID=UPI00366D3A32